MTKRKRGQIVIRKSNRLVEAKYKLDIWETRVFTKALSMIRKDDEDFKTYRIYLSDLIEEFGLVKGLSYKYLKEAAKSLNRRTVILVRDTKTGKREFQTNIVTGVDTAADDNDDADSLYIEIDFHKNLKSSLLELKREFTIYDIRNVVSLPSSYSYRVYELLKQYERIGMRTLDLRELKELVGAIEFFGDDSEPIDHYPLYGNFRQKVLLKAQRDLKTHTDIEFTFEPIKRGRKVHALTFFITKNKATVQAEVNPDDNDSFIKKVLPVINNWEDVDEVSVRNLLEKYGKERVLAACNQTQEDLKRGVIRGSTGKYFYGLVHNAPTLFDQRKDLRKKSKRKEKIAADRRNERRAIHEKLKVLQIERDTLKESLLTEAQQIYPELHEKIVKRIRGNRVYDKEKNKEQNYMRPAIKAMYFLYWEQEVPSFFSAIASINEKIEDEERRYRNT